MSKLSDLEATRLCAEAMGIPTEESFGVLAAYYREGDVLVQEIYDPLHDDAQAMALVKKLRLHIDNFIDGTWVVDGGWNGKIEVTHESLNRAIVHCVAQMQAGKVR